MKIKLSKDQLERENQMLAKRLLSQNEELTRLRACLELAEGAIQGMVDYIERTKDAHLIDTDDNPGQELREALSEIARVRKE